MESQRKLIYIADDEKSMRDWIAKYLNDYDLEFFSDGLSLKERYDEKCPDLIITDNNMPKLTGVGFIRYVREECKDGVPIVLVTADQDLAQLAKKYDFKFFLKPVYADKLRDFVDDLFSESH